MVGQELSVREIRREQALDQRILNGRTPGSARQPVGVEGVAQLDPIEVVLHAHLPPQRRQVLVAGVHLLGAHAVLGGQHLAH